MPKPTLDSNQRHLRQRIIDISWQRHLSHLGSCLSAVDIIDAIYEVKKSADTFILSNGHAGMAWYVVLEKHGLLPTQALQTINIHPDRYQPYQIEVSTGSLGQGLPIAVGMALGRPQQQVYCLISDGECAEGSIWEALRIIIEQKVKNITCLINANGWAAYHQVDLKFLKKRLKGFGFTVIEVDGHRPTALQTALHQAAGQPNTLLFVRTRVNELPFLNGQAAHYHVMTEPEYQLACRMLQKGLA